MFNTFCRPEALTLQRLDACKTRRALSGAHVPPTKFHFNTSVSTATGTRYLYTWHFPDVIKFRVAAHTISEKAIRFWHPDYNPDRAQKLISSSMSRHLSTRNISSKSMHAFLNNLSNRQTDKRSRAIITGASICLQHCEGPKSLLSPPYPPPPLSR